MANVNCVYCCSFRPLLLVNCVGVLSLFVSFNVLDLIILRSVLRLLSLGGTLSFRANANCQHCLLFIPNKPEHETHHFLCGGEMFPYKEPYNKRYLQQ